MFVNVLAQLVLPLAELVRGDLRELVHTLGMQAIATMLEQERTELCGERYKHAKDRKATRGGSTPGRLTLGGRTVQVRRPRVVDRIGTEQPQPGSASTGRRGMTVARRCTGVCAVVHSRLGADLVAEYG